MHAKSIFILSGAVLGCAAGLSAGEQMDKQAKQSNMVEREITPPVGRSGEMFVTADFLYWSARQDGLEFASTGITSASENSSAPISAKDGKKYQPEREWDPGFRVGLGRTLGHDGWDLYANYTWFYNDADGSNKNSKALPGVVENSFIETWALPAAITPYLVGAFRGGLSSVQATWNLHFNVVDLELGRNFFISNSLKLRPNFGLKAAWLDQKYKLIANAAFQSGQSGTKVIHLHQKQDFWGIGTRAGLNSAWQFTKSWSIVGDIAITALYGQFDNHRKDTMIKDAGASPDVTYTPTNISEEFYTLQPVVELALGLRWETRVSNDRYHIGFQAGWEEQVWFDHNRYITLGDDHSGNLAMQGLTLKGCFGF